MSFLKKYNRKSCQRESQSSNQSTALNQSLFSSKLTASNLNQFDYAVSITFLAAW